MFNGFTPKAFPKFTFRPFILLFLGFTRLFAQDEGASQVSIDIVFPPADSVLAVSDSSFIFGAVKPVDARLVINDVNVRVHPNGAFLAFLPVKSGDFVFRCVATTEVDSLVVLHNVSIPEPFTVTNLDSLMFDSTSITPANDLSILTGDVLEVGFKGTPGMKASFSVDTLHIDLPMVETSSSKSVPIFSEHTMSNGGSVGGTYKGYYTVTVKDNLVARTVSAPDTMTVQTISSQDTANLKIIYAEDSLSVGNISFKMNSPKGDNLIFSSPGKVSFNDPYFPRVVDLVREDGRKITARPGPGLVYNMFLPPGVKGVVTGKSGDYYRLKISESDQVWVAGENIRELPVGHPKPSSTINRIRVINSGNSKQVRIELQEKLPYRVTQSADAGKLETYIYGGVGDVDWIRYDFADDKQIDVTWSQFKKDVFLLNIGLRGSQLWGYDSYYDRNDLVMKITFAPEIKGGVFSSPLKDRTIVIDPGHPTTGGSIGAIGPTRLWEKDVNVEVSLILRDLLEKEGARVVMTKEDDSPMGLNERIDVAIEAGGEMLISVHHNALPPGVNPYANNGSSVIYYNLHSLELARSIQKHFLKKLKLPNFGLYYGDFALPRTTQMPAVITEAAFIIMPEQEASLRTEKFQKKEAEAIRDGIKEFLNRSRAGEIELN